MTEVKTLMDANDYLKKKLEECVPGIKNNYIPCNTEIEVTKNKIVVKCVDMDGVVMYHQEVEDYTHGSKVVINNLHFKLQE